MASLSVRRLDGEVIRRLKIRAQRDGLSVEETVRRILAAAVVDVEPVGAMIRRIIGDDGIEFDLPAREGRRADRLHVERIRPRRSRMILLDTKVLSEAMRVEPDGRVTLVGRTRRSDEIVQRESCGREPGAESPGGSTLRWPNAALWCCMSSRRSHEGRRFGRSQSPENA